MSKKPRDPDALRLYCRRCRRCLESGQDTVSKSRATELVHDQGCGGSVTSKREAGRVS